MRGLGKILIFLLCIVVVLFLPIQSFVYASYSYRYINEAKLLNELGLYDGISTTSFNPDLGSSVNRETGIALLVKLLGKRHQALSLSTLETDRILSPYSDKDKISSWAKKFIAYAIKTNMVQGDSPATISPEKPMDGKSYSTMILRSLGYIIEPKEWKLALFILSEKGGLTSAEAFRFNEKSLIKDDIVGISFGALSATSITSASLIDILVAGGVLTKIQAENAGFELKETYSPLPATPSVKTPSEEEIVYSLVNDALQNAESEINIGSFKAFDSSSKVFDLVDKVVSENPLILFYKSCTYWSDGRLQFKYSKDKNTILSYVEKLKTKAASVLDEIIKPGMNSYEKELAVHNYIINNTRYDTENLSKGSLPPEAYNAYGVLLLGKAVCQGYAETVKLLLDMLEIECIIVRGESRGIGHAWNIVKIEDSYYHLDSTWDDPVYSDGTDSLRYDYFNITDKDIEKDHTWNRNNYPLCTATKYNYYYHNNLLVKTPEEYYQAIRTALLSGNNKINLKILNYDKKLYDIVPTVTKVVSDIPDFRYSTYSYSVNEESGIIYVEFPS